MTKLKEKFVLVNEINWDGGNSNLPKEIKFPLDLDDMITNEEIEDLVPDILSDEWGYCVNSYSYEIIAKKLLNN
tara:strand:- start:43 stop:264 length:222 start_codon:yes stop_codon:yes gene_type:complete